MSMIGYCLAVSQGEYEKLISNPASIPQSLYPDSTRRDDALNLDKSWMGIGFMLHNVEQSGSRLTEFFFGVATADHGAPDLGYGPPLFASSQLVREIAELLNNVRDSDFIRQYDARRFRDAGIYPTDIWDEGTSARDYLRSNFMLLQRYCSDAAKSANAMIHWVS